MAGFRVPYHPEAFSISHGKKRPRVENGAHLKFVRRLPCVCCGSRNVEAAHIRMGSLIHAKRDSGKGEKPDDKWTLPLCRSHHAEQHSMAEVAFWRVQGIDPFLLALILSQCSGDEEAAEVAIAKARAR